MKPSDEKYLLKPIIPQPQPRYSSGESPTTTRLLFIGAALFIVALVCLFGYMQQRDEAAKKPDTVISTRSAGHIIAALHRCPPADTHTTQTLVLIVDAPPAGALNVIDCVRIARRSFQVRR